MPSLVQWHGDATGVDPKWELEGIRVDPNMLGLLEPNEILYEYGCEPLSYVVLGPDGNPLLIYYLCDFSRTTRYLVSAVETSIIEALKVGRIDVHAALRQPRCWIADIAEDASVKSLWQVEFDSIPADYLPEPGVLLCLA